LKQVERDLSQVAEAIDAIVAADNELRVRADILMSIPGIAKITAYAILTEMPELGHLSGKQAAALAGLAPISRQSGKWRGKERIQGGRASVRRAVYLPAVVATRFNPDMKAKYEQLVFDREMQEAGDHSRHAKVDCHGQRITARSTEMGRISSLTNTDTRQHLPDAPAGQWTPR